MQHPDIHGDQSASWEDSYSPGPEVIQKNFMLNSAEHEIFNVQKYKNIK